MPKARTPERVEFLGNVLVTAIEHRGYGFSEIVGEYYVPDDDPAGWYVEIADRYLVKDDEGYGKVWRVDLDTIAHGFGVFRKLQADNATPARWVTDLLLADRTNGEDGDVDVVGALAIVECALFGSVVYN